MTFDFFKAMNLVFLIVTVLMFGYFITTIQNSDITIGKKIAKESYIDENGILDKGEWMWNLGEFVAIMVGWAYLIEMFAKYSANDKQNPPTHKGEQP